MRIVVVLLLFCDKTKLALLSSTIDVRHAKRWNCYLLMWGDKGTWWNVILFWSLMCGFTCLHFWSNFLLFIFIKIKRKKFINISIHTFSLVLTLKIVKWKHQFSRKLGTEASFAEPHLNLYCSVWLKIRDEHISSWIMALHVFFYSHFYFRFLYLHIVGTLSWRQFCSVLTYFHFRYHFVVVVASHIHTHP